MALLRYSSQEFQVLGLRLSGFSSQTINRNGSKINNDRFQDKFYVCTKTALEVFEAIQIPGPHCISKPDPQDFLLCLYYLKKYPTKHELAGFVDISEKTALGKVEKYVKAIQALKSRKIRWIFDEDSNLDEKFILTVDGVHCRIWEPRRQPSAGWYSKKFNKAGLAYEVGVAIHHNQIVWVNGPFPAGQNDKKIYKKENGLMGKMPPGKKGIADDGYTGCEGLTTRNPFDDKDTKAFKERAKARQETINARLKAFSILNEAFRGTGASRLEKHKAAFEACCVLVQYELDNGSALFTI